jgi:nitrite reductase/ring-hydroxylating ferredoxin subunit
MTPAPPRDRFPPYPAAWYLFGTAGELRRRPLSRSLLGRRLVAFRTSSGRLVAMEARCSHLGADLGRGQIAGEAIRCPFHYWAYGPDGRCLQVPGTRNIPSFARQSCYPVVERHGFLFIFNGSEALFPLPFFFDADPVDFAAGRPFRFVADCPWYLLAANGFDGAHFQAVHDRTLLRAPEVDCPAPYARRIRYLAQVTGQSVFDRLIRRFAGQIVDVSITSWGGPFILVTGFFRWVQSYILIATRPLGDDRTLVEVIVFARRRSHSLVAALLDPLGLWVRRCFTHGFMQDDIDLLQGIRYNPGRLTAGDELMMDFWNWVCALRQHQSDTRDLDQVTAEPADREWSDLRCALTP